MSYIYMHNEKGNEIGPKGCGGRAFKLVRYPAKSRMEASDARHLDGSPMEGHSRIICESCGGDIPRPDIRNVFEDI